MTKKKGIFHGGIRFNNVKQKELILAYDYYEAEEELGRRYTLAVDKWVQSFKANKGRTPTETDLMISLNDKIGMCLFATEKAVNDWLK